MEPRTPSRGRAGAPAWQHGWRADYPCDTTLSLPYPQVPVSALLENAARRFPGRAACTLYGKPTSYADLQDQARRLARSLRDLGAGPGRFVAMLAPNIPEYLVAMQATWLTGASVLQLSPLMVAEEIEHWLEVTGCHLVIALDLLAKGVIGSLKRGPLEHIVLTSLASRMAVWRGFLYRIERLRRNGTLYLPQDAHRHRFANLLQNDPLEEPARVVPEEDTAVLIPTGGTTAAPKAVMLTHRNLVANAFQLRDYVGGDDGTEGVLGVLPFFHSYGLTVSLLSTWVKGGTVHLHPRFETQAVLNLLVKQRVELVPAVPAMLNALNGALRRRPHDLSFIRTVVSGASALDAKVRAEFESFGACNVVEGYGLTEASPVTHVNPPGDANRPGTIGLPLTDTEARVMDLETGTRELPDGEVGELAVRGPQVMKGYYKNPEATAAVLRDGWLFTGDIVSRDREGYYRIVDRKRDIIKTSGFLVFPAEVEEVLRTFPAVGEAAVVGVPDEERGEMVKALIVPRAGVKLDMAALEAHCKQHMGKQKRPRQIEVVSELPKNFLGKVLRRKLREAAPAGDGDGHEERSS
jgi:long-chain acyl-CoA synthetase